MKNYFLLLVSFFIISTSYSQSEASAFTPKWKVGDKKTFTSTTVEVSTKKSAWEDESQPYKNIIKFEITSEDPTNYHITVFKKDPVYNAVFGLENHEINNEFKDSIAEIKFLFNKTTREIKLENWEEMKFKIDEMIGKLESFKDSDNEEKKQVSGMLNVVLMPLKFSFKDEKTTTETFLKEIKYIFTPFLHPFKSNEKIKIEDKGENPFKPGDSLGMTTTYQLGDITETSCKITGETSMDMTEFKKMMIEMMKGFESLSDNKAGNKKSSKAEKEIANIDMSMTMSETLDYNPTTSWPNSYTHIAKVLMNDGKKKHETTSTTTVVVE